MSYRVVINGGVIMTHCYEFDLDEIVSIFPPESPVLCNRGKSFYNSRFFYNSIEVIVLYPAACPDGRGYALAMTLLFCVSLRAKRSNLKH
ncbi:MAG: hypothetical protein HY279_12815 [Nitrospinae bacterium]|nr:hypothetical protein [Nitrospinota bacterium]